MGSHVSRERPKSMAGSCSSKYVRTNVLHRRGAVEIDRSVDRVRGTAALTATNAATSLGSGEHTGVTAQWAEFRQCGQFAPARQERHHRNGRRGEAANATRAWPESGARCETMIAGCGGQPGTARVQDRST